MEGKWGLDLQWWLTVEQVISKARVYLNREGQIFDREEFVQRMTSWDLLYHIGRANFDGKKSGYVSADWERVTGGPDRERVSETWGRAKYEYGRAVEKLTAVGGGEGGESKVEVKWRDTREGSQTKGEEGTLLVDFVVCADGPSSGMRRLLLDEAVHRTYAGYVAFRGTVPEEEIGQAAAEVFVEKFAFFHKDGTQILAYTIPGINGTVQPGKRLVNWVWYWNYEDGSPEYEELMTDSSGNRHRYTLPQGKICKDVWERQMRRAEELLPPQFEEIVKKTQKPFVQVITDVEPPVEGAKVGRLLNGKAALLGDALAGFRPHTASGTGQAAFDALMLEKAFGGEMTWDEYEDNAMQFATSWQRKGVTLGNCSQFEYHAALAEGGQVREEAKLVSGPAMPMRLMARAQ